MTPDTLSELGAYALFGGLLSIAIGIWWQRRTGNRINLFVVAGAAIVAFTIAYEDPSTRDEFLFEGFAALFVAICFFVMVIIGPGDRRPRRIVDRIEDLQVHEQLRYHTSRMALFTRDLPENPRDNHVILLQIDREMQSILAVLSEHPQAAKDPFLSQELRGCASLLQAKGIRDPLLMSRFHGLYTYLHPAPSGLRRLLAGRSEPRPGQGTQLISHSDHRRY